ncbi:MAG: Fe-S cluster assembly protein SufD [Burkholderiaceae bacterium]
MSSVDLWRAAFDERAPTLPGASLPWLSRLRAQALERFADEGWPSGRLEAWRHTSLVFMNSERFAPVAAGVDGAVLSRVLAGLRESPDDHWLVFADGRFVPGLGAIGSLPAGVRVESLAAALAGDAEPVEALFGDVAEGASPQALNAALAADGAFIDVPAGVAVPGVIHLVFIAGAAGSAALLRNLIRAGAGAQLTVVEHYLASDDGAATLTNAVTRIEAGADARVEHQKLQQEGVAAVHLAAIGGVQARGSRLASHSLSFGARLARNDIGTRFDGTGCETLFNGLYHVDGKRHVDHHTWIEHASPHGTSEELYRGILDDQARGVFTGRIVVAPGAMRTDARQRADNLLLSAGAEADARPELEIYADDVKCAHGATVGQIDETSLFYLRTRGLDEVHARNLLTWAFAAEVLERIGVASLRAQASAALRAKLPGGEALEILDGAALQRSGGAVLEMPA